MHYKSEIRSNNDNAQPYISQLKFEAEPRPAFFEASNLTAVAFSYFKSSFWAPGAAKLDFALEKDGSLAPITRHSLFSKWNTGRLSSLFSLSCPMTLRPPL